MKPLKKLVRPNIWNLAPYSCARNEFSGRKARVFLDANENPYNQSVNRYPDPLQIELKEKIAQVKKVRPEQIFLGNGSDEAIDLAYRCFARPGIDNVVAIEPTYGMYKVCADINDVEYRPVLLDDKFNIKAEKLLAACDENTKIVTCHYGYDFAAGVRNGNTYGLQFHPEKSHKYGMKMLKNFSEIV